MLFELLDFDYSATFLFLCAAELDIEPMEQSIKNKFTTKQIIFYSLSAILGILFLVSAIAKTLPITPFIETISSHLMLQYPYASALARFIIGLEAGLGILLIIGLYGKWRWVLYTIFGMLAAFSAFIILLWIKEGNEADCGCMGEVVKLSPMWSLIKNIVMMAMAAALLILDKRKESGARAYFAWIIPVVFICYPFIFARGELAVDLMYPTQMNDSIQAPPIDLREGKHIVAFMSFTCSHCKKAAKNFSQIYRQDPQLPLLLVFGGKPEEQQAQMEAFFEETEAQDIPRHFVPRSIFRELAGRGVPSIYLLDGKEIEDKIEDYNSMSAKRFQMWYQ